MKLEELKVGEKYIDGFGKVWCLFGEINGIYPGYNDYFGKYAFFFTGRCYGE